MFLGCVYAYLRIFTAVPIYAMSSILLMGSLPAVLRLFRLCRSYVPILSRR